MDLFFSTSAQMTLHECMCKAGWEILRQLALLARFSFLSDILYWRCSWPFSMAYHKCQTHAPILYSLQVPKKHNTITAYILQAQMHFALFFLNKIEFSEKSGYLIYVYMLYKYVSCIPFWSIHTQKIRWWLPAVFINDSLHQTFII